MGGAAGAAPGERRTENGEQNARQARDGRSVCTSDKAKLPNFQASNCPCTPGTSATCQKDAVGHIGQGALTRPGEQRTERAGPEGQTFHGYRTPLRGDGVTNGHLWKVNPVGFLKPKHGVRSPPCPTGPPGRTCALCARTARPQRCLLRYVLCALCVPLCSLW